jgi:hypothetical protein
MAGLYFAIQEIQKNSIKRRDKMIIQGPVEYRLMKKNNGALVLQGLMIAINEDWREWRDILTENEIPTYHGAQKEGL